MGLNYQLKMSYNPIVMAAPAMLMVAPSGIAIEYVSGDKPRRLAIFMLTGILAAELRVKKAVIPDSRKHLKVSGNGLRRITM